MDKFIIQGNKELAGEIKVAGAKNSALKLIASSLLSKEECVFSNVPRIVEIDYMIELLESIGAETKWLEDNKLQVQCADIKNTKLDANIVKNFRSSIMTLTPLLARFGEVDFYYPGGCMIGKRPIDIYLDGFSEFGIEYKQNGDNLIFKVNNLKGSKFVFPWISHTVTESLIMLAVLAPGKSTLINTAAEVEVVQLCEFLNARGAKIKGMGSTQIEIEGVKSLSGGDVEIIPDRIETGTFAVLGALLAKDLVIKNCNPNHLEVFWKVLNKMGVEFELFDTEVKIKKASNLKPTEIRTHEYPGLVTDLQPPLTLLATQSQGMSLVHETIYEGRLFYTDFLNRMGANIVMCDPHRVVVNGPTKLYGAKLESPDIRAGITLVIAALLAEGESEIANIKQIDRGYENIEKRLNNLGAKISRVKVE